MENCPKGIKNEGRINALEDRTDRQDEDIKGLTMAVTDIRDRLLGRPSWPVVMIITFLSTLSVGLIVWQVSTVIK